MIVTGRNEPTVRAGGVIHAFRTVYQRNPREPGTKTRLPVRQKSHCEALTRVADPVTT